MSTNCLWITAYERKSQNTKCNQLIPLQASPSKGQGAQDTAAKGVDLYTIGDKEGLM